jgi:hypothetical protein
MLSGARELRGSGVEHEIESSLAQLSEIHLRPGLITSS